jgi:hypothetical protein
MRNPSQNRIVAIMAAVLILAVIAVVMVSVGTDPSETTKAIAVAVLALVPAIIIPFVILEIGKTAGSSEQQVTDDREYLMPLEETEEEEIAGKAPSSQ